MRFILLLLLAKTTIYAGEPLAIYLSWQEDPSSTMVVKWISDLENTQSFIHYAEESTSSWKKSEGTLTAFPNSEPYSLHTVILKNLTPKTQYSFHLEGEDTNYLFTTLPMDLEEPLSFIIGGDINLSTIQLFRETTLKAAELNPAFIVMGGDLACPSIKKNGLESPEKWLILLKYWFQDARHDNRLIPLVPVIGNHDIRGGFGGHLENAPYFSFLFLGEKTTTYSVLRLGHYASLYLLDSGHASPPGGEQAAWLAKELQHDKDVLHRIAVYHVPAYPPVRSYRNARSCAVRRAWVPLFDAYHLHLAFENHDHAYKRTYPLTDSSRSTYGVVYIGNGSWGVKPRVPKRGTWTQYLEKTVQARGFCFIHLEKEKRVVTAIGYNGETLDVLSQPVDSVMERENFLKDFNAWKRQFKNEKSLKGP